VELRQAQGPPGTVPPALQPEQLNTTQLRQRIGGMRAKERMIDDIIMAVADTVFYVVDELLNEDQRTIMHLVENAALEKSDQQIAIIHNWKRIDCTKTGEVQKMVQGQIIGPFAAKEAHSNGNHKKNFQGVIKWNSAWEFQSVDFWKPGSIMKEVTHIVLFDHKKCGQTNVNTFRMLETLHMRHKRTDKVDQSILERVGTVA
jgi:hypothetical protein